MLTTAQNHPSAIDSLKQYVLLPGQTPEGGHILSVLVKRSYHIESEQTCSRCECDNEIISGDVFWDSPMNSSLRFETDFIPYKLATDVVLNGTVYAPGGSQTTACVASLSIGGHTKRVQVIGDRVARYNSNGAPSFTDPTPFITMPLWYERAYGGIDVYSDKKNIFSYPRNPLGRGFVVTNSEATLDNLALPNLEDPNTPLLPEQFCIGDYAKWEQQPLPTSFGWFPKTWLPRAMFAGVLPADRQTEQELRKTYAQFVPKDQRNAYLNNGLPDMDFRFFSGASSGLTLPFLKGGEYLVTENLNPSGRLAFYLPTETPRIGIDIGEGIQEPTVALHTVMIHMDEQKLDMVWRGAIPYPGRDWLPQLKKLDIQVI